MKEYCSTCGNEISFGGAFKRSNERLTKRQTALVNFRQNTAHEELCQICAGADHSQIWDEIETEIIQLEEQIARSITAFPIFTCERLSQGVPVRYIGLVTANATVGTGIFNEFSQGFSDFFGTVNTESGMAHKVNTGEHSVRSLLVKKAVTLGANCILGVDIDYGATANNAATVNMQGTAAVIERLEDVLTLSAGAAAAGLQGKFVRLGELRGWLVGNFESSDGSEATGG